MELRVLRYFRAVVEEGSITDAAKAIHVTQPTLSRQMAQLEKEIGAPLFTRGRSGIELTDRGSLLNRYAAEIIDLADKAEEEVALPKHAVSGVVHIGAGETRAFSLIAQACARVRQHYPAVTFDIVDGTSADLKSSFARGFFDVLLDCEAGDNLDYNQITLPIHDEWGVVVRDDHPLAKLESVTPDALSAYPLVMSRQGMNRSLRSWAGAGANSLHLVATYGLPLNSAYLVSEGVGVMVTYGGLVDELNTAANLQFRPLSPAVVARHKVLWRKVMPTKPAHAFLDELKRICEE